jgi:hypothetical protein
VEKKGSAIGEALGSREAEDPLEGVRVGVCVTDGDGVGVRKGVWEGVRDAVSVLVQVSVTDREVEEEVEKESAREGDTLEEALAVVWRLSEENTVWLWPPAASGPNKPSANASSIPLYY